MFVERPPLLYRMLFPETLWRIHKREHTVYLTFDDGPVPEVTPWVLDTLDRYGVKATFFCVGDNVKRNPELFEEIKRRGHSVGNHTMNHMQGAKVATRTYLRNVAMAHELIQSPLFRPPHGLLRWAQSKVLRSRYTIIMYDLVSRDYSKKLTGEQVFENVKRFARNGSIIVFHDSIKAQRNMQYALPRAIEWLKNKATTLTASIPENIETLIKQRASALGLDACGIAQARAVDADAALRYRRWLDRGHNGCMEWAGRYCDVRDNPQLLLEGARSVIMVAMNYYPAQFQREDAPQFAYYAYGRDYHEVLRDRLQQLAAYIKEIAGCPAETRCCVDTAPLRERYWAVQAGIGFIGRNNALIIPGRGSYFFLGGIVTTLDLRPDAPCQLSCGECKACERACPAGALSGGRPVDATRCLSCLTIEYRGELPQWAAEALGNRVYGCDECQRACPHNRNAQPTTVPELQPSETFLSLTARDIEAMDQAAFSRIFSHSAVKRTKLAGLQRNLKNIK